MAHYKQSWVISRPIRKLTFIPQSYEIFMSVADGKVWSGAEESRNAHIEFEDRLDAAGFKRGGDYQDRRVALNADGTTAKHTKGGSGGRTRANLLEALGLYVNFPDRTLGQKVVRPTLAGQALLNGEPAWPIITKQVLAFQYPSVYSQKSNVNIDPRFQLRPIILLLRLLRHSDLGGYLTDEEVAACVLPYAEKHTATEADKIAKRILDFRARGKASMDQWYFDTFAKYKVAKHEFIPDNQLDYADTFMKWVQYTGYAQEIVEPGEGSRTVCNEDSLEEIDEVIEFWTKEKIIDCRDAQDYVQFQRRYGLSPDAKKDTRTLTQLSAITPGEREERNVRGVLRFLGRTELITSVTSELIHIVSQRTGISQSRVEEILQEVLPSTDQALDQFLDNYQAMASLGREEALAFEQATAEILQEVFGLKSKHIGQGDSASSDRRVPDVEVWSEQESSGWFGIIDTKAYKRYDLPSDHQLRMEGYLDKYASGRYGLPLRFFAYIAGGFVPNIAGRMHPIITNKGIAGSAINIHNWVALIQQFAASERAGADLMELFTLNREIKIHDIEQFLQGHSVNA